ncbi:MAG: TonB-dependent receptor, partial [Bacteroidales bacterium]|nr:TonB-dependent receptor [Bacteroidales bacterium]
GGVGVGTDIFSNMETRSLAGFGELSYQLTPSTVLTLGARYTRDRLDFKGAIRSTDGNPLAAVDDDKSYSGETFRIALRHDITDNMNVYASFNRGFKSGSFSPQSITTAPVAPQEVDAFEIGFKSELFDSRLRLNMAAFRYEVSDYQTRASSTADAASELINAAEVEITGFEVEFEAVPIPGLNIFGAVTFLDSEFSNFPLGPYSYLNPAVCTPGGPRPGMTIGQPTGGSLACVGDTKGNATPYAPDIAGNLGASYSHFVGTGELRLSMLYSYNDGFYFESDNRMHQPSFGIVNASVAYNPSPRWGVELWGKNLTDRVYYVQRVGSALADFEVPAAPRTYGVSLVYNY